MFGERYSLALTTNSAGDATGYLSPNVTGRILAVIVTVPGSGGIANATITITAEATGEAILTLSAVSASATKYPRVQVHGATGTGLTYDGTRTVNEPVTVVNDRVKVVVAGGGDTKSCTVAFVIG